MGGSANHKQRATMGIQDDNMGWSFLCYQTLEYGIRLHIKHANVAAKDYSSVCCRDEDETAGAADDAGDALGADDEDECELNAEEKNMRDFNRSAHLKTLSAAIKQ